MSLTPEPYLTTVEVARLLATSQEYVETELSHLALRLPGGALRWRRDQVLAALRPAAREKARS